MYDVYFSEYKQAINESELCFKDLDDFLLLQRNIEQAELEKNEMEEEYKKLAIIQRGKESQLRSKVKETEMLLTSLIKKRKEYSEIPEMTRY